MNAIVAQDTLQAFDADEASNGCECFFIKYEDFGIKLYACEAEANRVASRQRTASKHGLGPEVLSEVIAYDIPDNLSKLIASRKATLAGPVLYGYETEVVKLRIGTVKHQVNELRDKFEYLLGYTLYDYADYNVGYKPSGAMVCIDFGDGSFEDNF